MRKQIFAVAVAAALVLTGCTGTDTTPQTGNDFRFVSGNGKGSLIPAAKRKKVGAVTGELIEGGKFSLAADAGKIIVLNFWATWCGPCTTETPQFDSVYRAYKSRGVDFVGVDTKEGSRSAPESFIKNNDISYPIVFDEEGQTAAQLGKIPALSLPFTVLIDKQGRVAAVYLTVLTPKDLEPVLDKLVAET